MKRPVRHLLSDVLMEERDGGAKLVPEHERVSLLVE
jgi:hypothetical protein